MTHLLANLWFVLFHPLPSSGWADGKLVEVADQLAKMLEHPNSKSTQPGLARRWATLYMSTELGQAFNKLRWLCLRFETIGAPTCKSAYINPPGERRGAPTTLPLLDSSWFIALLPSSRMPLREPEGGVGEAIIRSKFCGKKAIWSVKEISRTIRKFFQSLFVRRSYTELEDDDKIIRILCAYELQLSKARRKSISLGKKTL